MSDLVERLRKRAEIRRQIPSRKSVQNNEPDRIADLLEEAADALEPRELSDEEINKLWTDSYDFNGRFCVYEFARAILQRASEK